jgi:hypothetical protein
MLATGHREPHATASGCSFSAMARPPERQRGGAKRPVQGLREGIALFSNGLRDAHERRWHSSRLLPALPPREERIAHA